MCLYTAETNLTSTGALTSQWTKTYTDPVGRTTEIVYADGSYRQFLYNGNNQLQQEIHPDNVTTAYAYNAKGERVLTALDPTALNRLTAVTNDVVTDHNVSVHRSQVYVATTSGAATTLISSTSPPPMASRPWNTTWNYGAPLTSHTLTSYGANGDRYSPPPPRTTPIP